MTQRAASKVYVPTEHEEAVALATWLRRRRIKFLHVPNEGKRSHMAGAKLKREGMKPGFPDYLILTPTDKAPRGAAIELKRKPPCYRKPTEAQQGWLATLKELGIPASVAKGAADAIEQLQALGY